jgi:hypothetical protein
MEKQLATAAYWIGVISAVLAIVTRGLALVMKSVSIGGRNPISCRTFLEGAILLFMMALASTGIAWLKERKA